MVRWEAAEVREKSVEGLPKGPGPPGPEQFRDLGADDSAELRGRGSSQHVPTADFQQQRAEHSALAAHVEPAEAQAVLQAAIRRFDTRAFRITFAEDIGLFFHAAGGQAASLVGEF